ncbi:MAG: SRPBCC domain-containing protein [Pseudomonadales bacterium]|nr:SRPBCC domain-containing protein [Pseudomonadales bacterium]
MLHFIEEREIQASCQQVHSILADIDHYKDWNPWIVHATGSTQTGEMLKVTANMDVGKPGITKPRTQVFQHRMLANESPHIFHWCDVGWFTLFADGNRKRTLTVTDDNRCHYRVELQVTGIASGLAKVFFGAFMQRGLKAESDALLQHAEQ